MDWVPFAGSDKSGASDKHSPSFRANASVHSILSCVRSFFSGNRRLMDGLVTPINDDVLDYYSDSSKNHEKKSNSSNQFVAVILSCFLFSVGCLLFLVGFYKVRESRYYGILPFAAILIIYIAVFYYLAFVCDWHLWSLG